MKMSCFYHPHAPWGAYSRLPPRQHQMQTREDAARDADADIAQDTGSKEAPTESDVAEKEPAEYAAAACAECSVILLRGPLFCESTGLPVSVLSSGSAGNWRVMVADEVVDQMERAFTHTTDTTAAASTDWRVRGSGRHLQRQVLVRLSLSLLVISVRLVRLSGRQRTAFSTVQCIRWMQSSIHPLIHPRVVC